MFVVVLNTTMLQNAIFIANPLLGRLFPCCCYFTYLKHAVLIGFFHIIKILLNLFIYYEIGGNCISIEKGDVGC